MSGSVLELALKGSVHMESCLVEETLTPWFLSAFPLPFSSEVIGKVSGHGVNGGGGGANVCLKTL